MKKLLAVLMAVLMLGSAFAIGASAEYTTSAGGSVLQKYNGYTIQPNEIVIVLQFNDCTSINKILVRNFSTGVDEWVEATGEVAMVIPVGASYQLPAVNAPSGKAFAGWSDVSVTPNVSYGTGMRTTSEIDGGKLIQYRCETTPSVAEKDTLTTIKTILVKVFGILIGLFYGNTDYGQELVASFFDSVFGAL